MSNVRIDSSITLSLNMPKILDKVENDRFGLFLAQEWKRLIQPYEPYREGIMSGNVTYRPFEFTYEEPYSHYMYGGIIYGPNIPIDINGNICFDDPSRAVEWRSPKHKYPTGRRFNYSKSHNPKATDHWDKAAEQAGEKDKLIQAANDELRRN